MIAIGTRVSAHLDTRSARAVENCLALREKASESPFMVRIFCTASGLPADAMEFAGIAEYSSKRLVSLICTGVMHLRCSQPVQRGEFISWEMPHARTHLFATVPSTAPTKRTFARALTGTTRNLLAVIEIVQPTMQMQYARPPSPQHVALAVPLEPSSAVARMQARFPVVLDKRSGIHWLWNKDSGVYYQMESGTVQTNDSTYNEVISAFGDEISRIMGAQGASQARKRLGNHENPYSVLQSALSIQPI